VHEFLRVKKRTWVWDPHVCLRLWQVPTWKEDLKPPPTHHVILFPHKPFSSLHCQFKRPFYPIFLSHSCLIYSINLKRSLSLQSNSNPQTPLHFLHLNFKVRFFFPPFDFLYNALVWDVKLVDGY